MLSLREEIDLLEPCEKCEGCVRKAHVLARVDGLARKIDALGGYPDTDYDRGYIAAVVAALALLEGRELKPNVSSRGEKRPARDELGRMSGIGYTEYVLAIVEAIDALGERLDRA